MNNKNEKHLEFIQGAINRMSSNSFQMKGWAILIVSALLTIDANTDMQNSFILIAIPITILFWMLDAYYLQQERKFRGIYTDVAELTDEKDRIDIRNFEMPLHKYNGWKYSFFRAFICSGVTTTLYILVILLVVVIRYQSCIFSILD